jgi:hypothetical protein
MFQKPPPIPSLTVVLHKKRVRENNSAFSTNPVLLQNGDGDLQEFLTQSKFSTEKPVWEFHPGFISEHNIFFTLTQVFVMPMVSSFLYALLYFPFFHKQNSLRKI